MADATTTTTADTTATTTAAPPWYQGIDAEILGHWDNKGWKKDDPKEISLAATKQARELEKHFGVPADQLLKLPKADAKPDEIKAFWGKLGAPAEAKDYDFNGVKLDDALATALRDSMARNFVPKDKAAALAADVAKHLESAETQKATVNTGKLAEEQTQLKESWKANYDYNHLKAMEGARRTGITPEGVKAMEGQIGYAAVMEHFRKIGQGTSEDAFVEGNRGPGGSPTTREGAMSRKDQLMADKAWGARYLAGGVPERQEMDQINQMIDGVAA